MLVHIENCFLIDTQFLMLTFTQVYNAANE